MPTDPGILLQGTPPPNPLEQYGRVVALKNALQQNQIGAQQLQEGNIGIQQKQLLFDDQQKISKVLSDPSVNGDIEKAIPMLGPAGVSGQSILSITKGLDEHREKIANVTKAQAEAAQANQKVEGEQKGLVDDMLQGLANNPNATAADLLSRAHILTTTSPALAAKVAPIIAQIQNSNDPDGTARQIVQSAATASSQAKAAETRKNIATAQGEEAALPGKAAQSAQQVRANLAAQLAAAQPGAEYNKVLGAAPFQIAQEFAGKTPEQARQLGMTPEQQATAAQAATRETETARHNQIEEKQGSQRVGIEQSRNAREAQIYQQTYGSGANEALVGVEPKLRTAATAAAQKAADDHAKAVSAQRDMETFISLARANNKEAYAYLSPEGVLTLNTGRGVTRVNKQEIEAYGGAGSWSDLAQGAVGKAISGKSVSDSVINDIEKLHQKIAQNTDQFYNDKIGSINQNYHANFKPVQNAAPAAAAPKFNVGDTVNYQGKPHKVTAVGADGKLTLAP